MNRLNIVLFLALLASCVYLVSVSYDARRLYAELDAARNEEKALATEFERLQAERQAQATPLKVERLARDLEPDRHVGIVRHRGNPTRRRLALVAGAEARHPERHRGVEGLRQPEEAVEAVQLGVGPGEGSAHGAVRSARGLRRIRAPSGESGAGNHHCMEQRLSGPHVRERSSRARTQHACRPGRTRRWDGPSTWEPSHHRGWDRSSAAASERRADATADRARWVRTSSS